MPSYQTARLEQYEPRFLAIAEDIFARIGQTIPAQVERHLGSFSVYAKTVKDTAAKILIYDPRLGRESNWPHMSDGVYIWVRADGPTGELIWGDILPIEMPWLFGRMRRNITVQISANPQADFAYFPVMAGDDLSEIANLLVGCSRV